MVQGGQGTHCFVTSADGCCADRAVCIALQGLTEDLGMMLSITQAA